MKIDLFTFIAQIINFIILIILLYFFLYKKIIRAIDQREKKIRDEFEKAQEEKKAAEEEKSEYEKSLHELEERKEELLAKAHEEASQEKKQMLEQIRSEVEEKKRSWEKKIETQKKEFLQTLQKKIGSEVYGIAESILGEISNAELQKQIYLRFLENLKMLNDAQIADLKKSYRERKKEAIDLVSSHELTSDEKNEIQSIFSQILEEEPKIHFDIDPEYTLGITVKFDGFRLSWTAKNYFEKLDKKFQELLEQKNE